MLCRWVQMKCCVVAGLGGFGRAELEAELGDMTTAQGLNDRPRRGVRAGIQTDNVLSCANH